MRQTLPNPSTRHIITSTRGCEWCGETWPGQKLFHCNRCRTTICLICQCRPGPGFHSHVQDCMAFPHNYLIGPSTVASSKSSRAPQMPSPSLSLPKKLPFTHLQTQSWLHDRPVEDVYRLLIDSYRLHSYDKFTFLRDNKPGSIFAGMTDSAQDFHTYLSRAATRSRLLPQWWTPLNVQDCVQIGQQHSQFHDLHIPLTPAMVMDHYHDASFPTQLRIFAEQIMGQQELMDNCTPMLGELVELEKESGDTSEFEWKKYNKTIAIQNWPGRF